MCACAWVGGECMIMRMRMRLMVCIRLCVEWCMGKRACWCAWARVCACSACMSHPSLDAGWSCTNVRPSRRITCNGRSSRGLQRRTNKQTNKQAESAERARENERSRCFEGLLSQSAEIAAALRLFIARGAEIMHALRCRWDGARVLRTGYRGARERRVERNSMPHGIRLRRHDRTGRTPTCSGRRPSSA